MRAPVLLVRPMLSPAFRALSQTGKDDRAELLGTASTSHRESEELVHESNLPDGVPFRQPSDLSFADHVHRFITFNSAMGLFHKAFRKRPRWSLFESDIAFPLSRFP
jgi:hypothetical protein